MNVNNIAHHKFSFLFRYVTSIVFAYIPSVLANTTFND